ncbi:hypothetical protein Tsubulata_017758 [Turnera subulata]|uniref:Uncharacterized protein n=1 Tax=Turnera subulata TaxID=218843 RepID=A0A9Q0J8A5_9ROSI|nr:hypothetical protein Tsubulata_017758 [Turnera subulata]
MQRLMMCCPAWKSKEYASSTQKDRLWARATLVHNFSFKYNVVSRQWRVLRGAFGKHCKFLVLWILQ